MLLKPVEMPQSELIRQFFPPENNVTYIKRHVGKFINWELFFKYCTIYHVFEADKKIFQLKVFIKNKIK